MSASANGTTSINTQRDSSRDCYEPTTDLRLSLLSSGDCSNHWASHKKKRSLNVLDCIVTIKTDNFLTQSFVFLVVFDVEHMNILVLIGRKTFETPF